MYNHLKETEISSMLNRMGIPTSHNETSSSVENTMRTDEVDNIYFHRPKNEHRTLAESQQAPPTQFLIYIRTQDEVSREVDIAPVLDKQVWALKKLVFPYEVSKKKVIKLIYRGRLLKDNENLSDLKLEPLMYVHAAITDKSGEHSEDDNSTNASSFTSETLQMQQENYDSEAQRSAAEQNHVQVDVRNFEDGDGEINPVIRNLLEQIRGDRRSRSEFTQSVIDNYEEDQRRRAKMDFIFGVVFGIAFGFIGLLLLVCLKSSQDKKNGAIYGVIIKLFITLIKGGPPQKESSM